MYKKLSSKVVFKHPRLVVEEDDIELESGKKTKYLRYGYGGDGVVIIALNNKDEVLFLKEYSYVPNKILLQLPMGQIENNENILQAANRELQEETGFKANNLREVGSYYQNHRRSTSKGYVFIATELEDSVLQADSEEENLETVWIAQKDIQLYLDKGQIADTDTLSSLRLVGC